ncbi:MAG: hypothetical protein ACI9KE_002239 [Polyangiales bacterium]|jgi:hypothetical protein
MDLKLPVVAALLLTACSPHAFSPPGRTLPLETAAAVGVGNTAVQLEGGISAQVLGPGVVTASARVRHGVGEQTDLNVEGNFAYFVDGDPQIDMHRGIYSGRIGLKHAFGEHFALTGGVGAGGSAAGAFISPDFGFILSFENPYVVPFFSARVVLSQPMGAREVEFVDDGVAFSQAPAFTYGYAFTTGVRVPLGPIAKPLRPAILVGFGMTHIFDGEDEAAFMGVNLGFEVTL